MSTTAGSEAVSLFLVLAALFFYERARRERGVGSLLAAAALLNLACATRYDVWLLLPLLCLDLAWSRNFPRATLLAVTGLVFPLVWMLGNWRALGDPLAPFHVVDEFHRAWVARETSHWGSWRARFQGLFFWPGVALLTLSPGLAFCGLRGLGWAVRRPRELGWLLALVLVPTVYFSARGFLLTFVPLARFAVNQVVLLLPFARVGFLALTESASPRSRRVAFAGVVALGLGTSVSLGLGPAWSDNPFWTALRPVSPVSRNVESVRRVSAWIRKGWGSQTGPVLLDADDAYSDLQIAFLSGLEEERLVRQRWPQPVLRRERHPPRFVLLLPEGRLAHEDTCHVESGRLTLDGRMFVPESGVPFPYRGFRLLAPGEYPGP
jgi:hypothetical protein